MSADLRIADIYNLNPGLDHSPGDIWHCLPTFGVLPAAFLPAVVITPACDLAQKQTETISYLPLVPLAMLFALPGYLPDVLKATNGQMAAAGSKIRLCVGRRKYVYPTASDLDVAANELAALESAHKSEDQVQAAKRASAGIRVIREAISGQKRTPSPSDVVSLFGKDWSGKFEKIAKSAVADIHFFPRDEQPSEWSGIPVHSVALFRYPLSVPIELLNVAQDLENYDWDVAIEELVPGYPVAQAFKGRRPMKRATLKPDFSADLLTRYTGLFVRIGSPDFTAAMLQGYRSDFEAGR